MAPLLPPSRPRPKGGPPPVDGRAALAGTLFVLQSGIPWGMLPQELGCGGGMTLLAKAPRLAGGWGCGRGCTGSCSTCSAGRTRSTGAGARARQRFLSKGGALTDPNPTDRGKAGTKRHVLVDANGVPLVLVLTLTNVHDSTMLEPVLDAVPPIRKCAGRPRKRPAKLHADKVATIIPVAGRHAIGPAQVVVDLVRASGG